MARRVRRVPVFVLLLSLGIQINHGFLIRSKRSQCPSLLRESSPETSKEESSLFEETTSSPKPAVTFGSSVPMPNREITIEGFRSRNRIVATISVALGLFTWIYQFLHPLEPLQILAELQSTSTPMSQLGRNGKPTIVDFWAPWCENCKFEAATLKSIRDEYQDQVNFVLVNGDDWRYPNTKYIEEFRVDAIPHVALVDENGRVQTTLIGIIPKSVLQADIRALLDHQELPHKMLDVFDGRPDEARQLRFHEE